MKGKTSFNIMTLEKSHEKSFSSNESFTGEKYTDNEVFIKEKLYRRYLVKYYQPLFEHYLYEEIKSNQKENTQKKKINNKNYEKLALLIQKSYLKKAKITFDAINKSG